MLTCKDQRKSSNYASFPRPIVTGLTYTAESAVTDWGGGAIDPEQEGMLG